MSETLDQSGTERLRGKEMDAENRTGGRVWLLSRLRSEVLVSVLDDMVRAEATGFPGSVSIGLRNGLEFLANRAADVPDRIFPFPAIHSQFDKLIDCFDDWASITGTSANCITDRRRAMRRMRDRRHRLSVSMRRAQAVLGGSLDTAQIVTMYKAMQDLTLAFPQIFISLTKSLLGIDKAVPGLH